MDYEHSCKFVALRGCYRETLPFHWFGRGFSWRISDFSFTNSLATSSFVRCDRMRKIVHPVSSIWILLPNDNQHAHEPWKHTCKRRNVARWGSPCRRCPSAALWPRRRGGPHGRSSSPSRRCAARSSPTVPRFRWC